MKRLDYTKVSVKLKKSEWRDEWFIYLEAYPVYETGNDKPKRVREYLRRSITTPIWDKWKSHATLTLLATQDLPTFGYNMIDPLKSWCWGSILFYPFKISRFS